MKVRAANSVLLQEVTMPGAVGCQVRWLVSRDDDAPNFAMRQFEIEPGGFTPRHHHPYEHEVYVIEGEGEVWEGVHRHAIRQGDVILVHPDDVHQFRNCGSGPLKFLCLVPNSADNRAPADRPECSVVATKGTCD